MKRLMKSGASLLTLLLAGFCYASEGADPVIRVESPVSVTSQNTAKQARNIVVGKPAKPVSVRVMVNGKPCDPNDPNLSPEVKQAVQKAVAKSQNDLKRINEAAGNAKITMTVNGKPVELKGNLAGNDLSSMIQAALNQALADHARQVKTQKKSVPAKKQICPAKKPVPSVQKSSPQKGGIKICQGMDPQVRVMVNGKPVDAGACKVTINQREKGKDSQDIKISVVNTADQKKAAAKCACKGQPAKCICKGKPCRCSAKCARPAGCNAAMPKISVMVNGKPVNVGSCRMNAVQGKCKRAAAKCAKPSVTPTIELKVNGQPVPLLLTAPTVIRTTDEAIKKVDAQAKKASKTPRKECRSLQPCREKTDGKSSMILWVNGQKIDLSNSLKGGKNESAEIHVTVQDGKTSTTVKRETPAAAKKPESHLFMDAKTSRSELRVGETFDLTFKVTSDREIKVQQELGKVKGAQILGKTFKSQQNLNDTFKNGKRNRKNSYVKTFTYTLKALRPGVIDFTTLATEVNGKSYTVLPAPVKVKPAAK